MRLLLDEMVSSAVAEALRHRGHDVVALQDPELSHLRGLPDGDVLDAAVAMGRAVVTDNVADFMHYHGLRVAAEQHHHGIVLFTNTTFPRHRHDQFVRRIVAALACLVDAAPPAHDEPRVWWLVDA